MYSEVSLCKSALKAGAGNIPGVHHNKKEGYHVFFDPG